jgi:hypothetical protein
MILLIGKCHRHISIFTYSLGFISLFHGSNGVLAAPQGGQVLSGEVGISQASVGGQPVTTITQSSNKATIGRQVCHWVVRLAKHRHCCRALHPCTPVLGWN